jgi:preprotein translocase subunit SecG
MKLALGIVVILMSIALTVLVLMQSGKGKKLSSTITGSSDTFFSKGKAQSKDKILSRVTTILAVVFILLTLVTVIVITVLV